MVLDDFPFYAFSCMAASRIAKLVAATVVAVALIYIGGNGVGSVPPLSLLLDPVDGLHHSARIAEAPIQQTLTLDALDAPVTVVRDNRYVPHIFAESDKDAITALGYLVAQDRLFQLDFVPRVASGNLAEAFGEGSVEADRFLRSTGMDWGARKNLDRIRREGGIEQDLINWYGAGVRAHMQALTPKDLPLEFRLLGYEPEPFSSIQAMRVLQYMTYDLTYGSDSERYGALQAKLDSADYATLYPDHPAGLYVPIIPPSEMGTDTPTERASNSPTAGTTPNRSSMTRSGAAAILSARADVRRSLRGTLAEGFIPGKGSNNWAVHGSRSKTGAPMLSNDMHLSLSLPPIWYEAHLVTPNMNVRGLTVPGAPVLVQGFTPDIGWGFTNTGADQVDHYAMEVRDDRSAYRFNGEWRELESVIDTIRVKDGDPVADTLYYSHWGPVHFVDEDAPSPGGDANGRLSAVAEQWVAHKQSTTLKALWGMAHADSLESFEAALQDWDTPMQNIVYAGRDGHIAIRSAGHLPVRRAGHGRGLLNGKSTAGEWTGRVAFDQLPYSRDPGQGYLFSANQKPTNDEYPYYQNHDWRDSWRSIRLDSLFSGKKTHSVDDLKAYQADVDVQQRDAFVPLMEKAGNVSPEAREVRNMLIEWNGVASMDRPEPLALDIFLSELRRLMWDEPVFDGENLPEDAVLIRLAQTQPRSPWFDIQDTNPNETLPGLARQALVSAADSLYSHYGDDPSDWLWGDHHTIVFRHLTQSEQLKPLWRGPISYPGFDATVSPARGREATHSASQRLIVDFSGETTHAYGVLPGGQSGDPLHPKHYDDQLDAYVNFELYPLNLPATPDEIPDSTVTRTLSMSP